MHKNHVTVRLGNGRGKYIGVNLTLLLDQLQSTLDTGDVLKAKQMIAHFDGAIREAYGCPAFNQHELDAELTDHALAEIITEWRMK